MTSDRRSRFLAAVLGSDGARALTKAAERSPELGNAMWPRTILAWLNTCRGEFEGELPGVENTYVTFAKSEQGYTGSIAIGEELYKFQQASVFEALAAVAVALDLDRQMPAGSVRDLDLERLGKSIDLMVKTKAVVEELAKAEDRVECPECGCKTYRTKDGKVGYHSMAPTRANCKGSGKEPGLKKEELGKTADAPTVGQPHAPQAPAAPTPATKVAPPAPAPKPKMNRPKVARPAKPAASHTLKLSQSEAKRACPACGQVQFKNEAFRGCMCLRDLAKSARVIAFEPEGILLELTGQEWDEDAVSMLLETVGRPR